MSRPDFPRFERKGANRADSHHVKAHRFFANAVSARKAKPTLDKQKRNQAKPRLVDSESGVSIIFACLLLLVLMIIGGIILSYGYSNSNRATENITQEQSRLTVNSACETLLQTVGTTRVNHSGLDFHADSDASNTDASSVAASLMNSTQSAPVSISANGFSTVKAAVTAKPENISGTYEITCWEDGKEDGQIVRVYLIVSGSEPTYNVKAQAMARQAAEDES